MTSQQPRTPTTEVIREAYIGEPPYALYGYTEEEFDRWLSTVEAAAEQRGAVKELKHLLRELMEGEFQVGHHAGLHTASTIISARVIELWDSADQEGDDETH